jgi:LysM repeat protein
LTAAPESAAALPTESSLAAPPAADTDNRYGEIAPAPVASATPAAAVSPPEPADTNKFAEGWPAIQSALERGELARAHLLLSQWYGDPSLTPEESQQVETLLSQLAGTVVYSTEHQLEPPYMVRSGDTLESIAQQYNVPWQLLAKINGIPAANQVQPGQQLKVVRGPFSAVIETSRNQLTLMLDGRYAGRFSVDASSAPLPEGEWVVADKPMAPLGQTSPYGASMSAATAVARSLRLESAGASAATPGMPITIGSQPPGEARLTGLSGSPAPGSMPASPCFLRVAPSDADELVDILSIGSRVEVRR